MAEGRQIRGISGEGSCCEAEKKTNEVRGHRAPGGGGFWAEVPSLPGCVSQGETLNETLENVKEAIELFLECMIEDGEKIPSEQEEVSTVTVEVPIIA